MDQVERRLKSLERQCTWMKRGCALLLSAVGAAVLMGQSAPAAESKPAEVLKTERLVIVDKNGRERSELLTDAKGTYFLMYNDKGAVRATMSVKGDKFGLTSFDSSGQPRMVLSTGPDGSLFYLWDEKLLATSAVLAAKGVSSVRFERKGAEIQPLVLAADTRGSALLQVAGTDGKVRLRIGFENNGAGKIETLDADGTVTSQLPKK